MPQVEPGPARRPLLIGLLVALVLLPLLFALHHEARPALTATRATRLALAAPQVHATLGAGGGLKAQVESLDGRLTRVDFFRGGRIVAAAALTVSGRVVQFADYASLAVPYGNWLAYQPGIILGLSLVFVLMTAVRPWRRIRNLDVLASLVLVGAGMLFAQRYLQPSLIVAAGVLLYLLVRCAGRGLGMAGASPGERSLVDLATARLAPAARRRILRLMLAAVGLSYVMVAISSPQAVDVVYAVMEGATRLLHGVLPYGHLPGDVVHGDTYPLLSYLLYVPLAAIQPVSSVWDSVDVALGAAALAALCSGGVLLRLGSGAREDGREEEGLRLALTWLCFPPVLIATSSGTTDVILAPMLVGAILLWRRPAATSALITAAGWFKLAPFALLPLCLAARRGRELVRSGLAAAAVSVPLLVLLVVLGGLDGPVRMLRSMAFQFTRGTPQSVWAALGISGWQPVAQALAAGLLVAGTLRLRRDPDAGPAQIAALSAAILLALQLAANYWSFLYVMWFAPLLTIALFSDTPSAVAWPAEIRARAMLPGAVPVGV